MLPLVSILHFLFGVLPFNLSRVSLTLHCVADAAVSIVSLLMIGFLASRG